MLGTDLSRQTQFQEMDGEDNALVMVTNAIFPLLLDSRFFPRSNDMDVGPRQYNFSSSIPKLGLSLQSRVSKVPRQYWQEMSIHIVSFGFRPDSGHRSGILVVGLL
jgi:hypothetical protein